ncbi:MAG: hypothetical protein K2W33_07455 [Burkholderiales bacterium]|nr:hypothetical protein [Burkholderiales bacterium]
MSIQSQNTPMPPLQAHSSQRRSCDELGMCQNRKPACPGCTWRDTSLFDKGVHHFAPGVIDGGPAKPSLLRRWGIRNGVRWVGVACLAGLSLASCAYNAGYLSVMLGGGL